MGGKERSKVSTPSDSLLSIPRSVFNLGRGLRKKREPTLRDGVVLSLGSKMLVLSVDSEGQGGEA